MLIYPFLQWLRSKGLSYNLSLFITIIGTLLLGITILLLLFFTLKSMIIQIPQFKLASSTLLAQPANKLFKTVTSTVDLSNVAGILINIIENGFFVLLATIFLLYELPKLRVRLNKYFRCGQSFINTFSGSYAYIHRILCYKG